MTTPTTRPLGTPEAVERFGCDTAFSVESGYYGEMAPDPTGEWMRYSDHARIVAERDARIKELERDAERLDAIATEYWDVLSFSMPTGAGDADVGWRIIDATERVIAELFRDDMRAAIDAALTTPPRDPSLVTLHTKEGKGNG